MARTYLPSCRQKSCLFFDRSAAGAVIGRSECLPVKGKVPQCARWGG